MTAEMDPCPFCGKNRKLVGYRHHCTPETPQFTPGQLEARRAVDAAIGKYKEEAEIPPEVVAVAKRMMAKPAKVAPKKRTPAPEIAAVAAQIEEKKAAKAREGKKSFTVWLDEGCAHQLKIASAKHKVTQEAIVGEAIAEILAGKYKP